MYKRISNIADKIKDARLKIDEWRVLFAVDNKSDAQKIADFLELSIEKVNDALAELVKEGYVSTGEEAAAEEKQAETPAAEETIEEKAEELVEGLFTEEKEKEKTEAAAEVEEPVLDETPEETSEEEDILSEIVEEVVEEVPAEEAPESQEEEPSAEAEAVEDLPVEEEISLEEAKEEKPTPAEEKEEELEEIILDEETEEEPLQAVEEESQAAEEPAKEEVALEEEPEAAAPAAPAAEKKSGDAKTIMVVDDSIVIRKMVEIAVENENYTIETAVSGKEALKKVDAVNPDLVILDIMLPDVSGIEILKAIKASKGIPVIMLSGKNSPQDLELAKTQGADDFAPKPFKEEELVEKIKALI